MRKKLVSAKQLFREYLTLPERTRVILQTVFSSAFNALLGIAKLVLGIVAGSPWCVINAVYYLLLGLGRGSALQNCFFPIKSKKEQTKPERKHGVFLYDGFFLCLLGVSYLLISIRMYFRGDVDRYPEYLVYGVILIALAKLVGSIIGLLPKRGLFPERKKDRRLSIVRLYSLMDACVSVVVSRCAILMIVEAPNAVPSSAVFGMLVSVAMLASGLFVLMREITEKRKTYD